MGNVIDLVIPVFGAATQTTQSLLGAATQTTQCLHEQPALVF